MEKSKDRLAAYLKELHLPAFRASWEELARQAQQEIRDYANAMFSLIQPIVPIAAEAFMDYNFHSLRLSRLEIEALRTGLPLVTDNKRELTEWEEKKKRLGIK